MRTTGQTILITGGTSGIGLGFAEEFVRLGNTVIICGRREERLTQIEQKHQKIITKVCDVSDAEQREALYSWITKNYPATNILINNAGIQLLADLTQPVNLGRIQAEVETNFVAPLHLASLFAGHLSAKPEAAIINISSGLAFAPIAIMPIYCATKAALHSLTLSLRHQLKETSVKVFEIVPPAVDTELGSDRRSDPTQSHGGIPVSEVLAEAMGTLENDVLETAIGMAKGLRAKREDLFTMMNQ